MSRADQQRQARWDRREERVYEHLDHEFFGTGFSDDRNTYVQGAKANFPKLEELANLYGQGGLTLTIKSHQQDAQLLALILAGTGQRLSLKKHLLRQRYSLALVFVE